MGSYATANDLKSQLAEDLQAELSGVDTDPDTSIVNVCINDAEDFIHGFLGGYQLPVSGALSVKILRVHTLIIARTYLVQRRFAGRYDASMAQQYQASLDWLKASPNLPDAPEQAVSDTPTDTSSVGSDTPIFSTASGWGSY